MWNRSPVQVRCMKQGTQSQCTGTNQREGMGNEVGGVLGWGTHVHVWLIHVNVWQKLPQYSKVIKLSSVAQSCPTMPPHELQHARPPCPSPTPRVYSNSCPSSQWCHPTLSSSVIPFSSCPQSFPASRSFPMSQLFAWGGQSIGVSASTSVLPRNSQDWSP